MLRQHGKNVGQISGEIFPPSPISSLMATLFFYTFCAGLFVMVLGEWLFNQLQIEQGQRLVRFMKENQAATITVLLVANWLSSQLLSTGAFEVFYDDDLVFSKLHTGSLPEVNDLLRQLNQRSGDFTDYPAHSY